MQFYYLKDNCSPSCKHLTAAGRGFVITKRIIIHSEAYPKETLCLYTQHWSKKPAVSPYKELFNISMQYFSSPLKRGFIALECQTDSPGDQALPSVQGRGWALQTFSTWLWNHAPVFSWKAVSCGSEQSWWFLIPAVKDLWTFRKPSIKNRAAKNRRQQNENRFIH